MLCFPNCKINIGLYVTRKRDDGYHDLDTVFYPLDKHDALEAVPAEARRLHMSGLPVAGNEQDNLVWKACELLKADYPDRVGTPDIYLYKAIPMGAGLGGGSADGAYMLQLLNELYTLGLDKAQLAKYALRLGSDCPFFIYNKPKYATGRGEIMTDIPIDLTAYSLQLVCPRVHVATGKAFAMLSPKPAPYDLHRLHELPVSAWRQHISNDFEEPVFRMHPQLAVIKEQLYAQGAVYASMSGSGSAIYGIFPKERQAVVDADTPADIFYLR